MTDAKERDEKLASEYLASNVGEFIPEQSKRAFIAGRQSLREELAPKSAVGVREIMTSNHDRVLVDAEDFPFLSRFSWRSKLDKNTFYALTNIFINGKQTTVSMHRMITGIRNVQVDHRNRDGLDNRKENLRFCTSQQNSFNRVRKNKFGFRGVYFTEKNGFGCQIQISGKRHHRTGFLTAEDAARAYDEMSLELHGEFGIRNFNDDRS